MPLPVNKLRQKIIKEVLEGGAKPSRDIMHRIMEEIANSSQIIPRNLGREATNPITGNVIQDIRLARARPYTFEYPTMTVKPGMNPKFSKTKVHYSPKWEVQAFDRGGKDWEGVENFFPAKTFDPLSNRVLKEDENIAALESLARWMSRLGEDVDLQRFIPGLKDIKVEKGSLSSAALLSSILAGLKEKKSEE